MTESLSFIVTTLVTFWWITVNLVINCPQNVVVTYLKLHFKVKFKYFYVEPIALKNSSKSTIARIIQKITQHLFRKSLLKLPLLFLRVPQKSMTIQLSDI